MEQKYYSLIEVGFTGAVVLGFAIWQLVSINREIGRDKAKKADAEADAKSVSPESAGHPVGEHRLDDR